MITYVKHLLKMKMICNALWDATACCKWLDTSAWICHNWDNWPSALWICRNSKKLQERQSRMIITTNMKIDVTLVEECTELFYANLVKCKILVKSSCWQLMKRQRYCCNVWLVHSVWPSVCGWWLEDSLQEILTNVNKCLQNWDPWPLIMLSRRPWSWKTSLITRLHVSSLLMLLRYGIKCAIVINS